MERKVERGSGLCPTLRRRERSVFSQINIGSVLKATLGRLERQGGVVYEPFWVLRHHFGLKLKLNGTVWCHVCFSKQDVSQSPETVWHILWNQKQERRMGRAAPEGCSAAALYSAHSSVHLCGPFFKCLRKMLRPSFSEHSTFYCHCWIQTHCVWMEPCLCPSFQEEGCRRSLLPYEEWMESLLDCHGYSWVRRMFRQLLVVDDHH